MKIPCPNCNQRLDIPEELAGQNIECPACNEKVNIPVLEPVNINSSNLRIKETKKETISQRPDLTKSVKNLSYRKSSLHPHRANQVLVFGIIGCLCCWPLGIVAWVMGYRDLQNINDGIMDPTGKSLTVAGMTCGIVGTVLLIIALLLRAIMML